MSEDKHRRPGQYRADQEFLAISREKSGGQKSASGQGGTEAFRSVPRSVRREENTFAARLRGFGLAALGMCAMVAVALGLAQGLTAGLMTSSWPSKVTGVSGTSASYVSLDVERRVPREKRQQRGQWQASAEDYIKLARIDDITQGPAGGSADLAPEYQGYLPPNERQGIANSAVIIKVPASQGRLLRFDAPVESVFVADPAIADIRVVSSNIVYVYGKKVGLTNILAISSGATDSDGAAIGPVQIRGSALLEVVADLLPAVGAKNQFTPGAPADFFIFGTRTGAKGKLRNIGEAIDFNNILQTYSPNNQPPINATTFDGSNQVNIRVRFAEVSRQDLKSFGIDWNVAVNAGSFSFGLQKDSRSTFGTNPNTSLGVSAGNFDIGLLIEALQNNGALRVLAEPNLTAVTGQTASFLAGGEVPVPVPTSQDSNAVTVQFKQFGVSLAFTPTLIKGNRIALRVKPEVSSISATTDFAVQGFNLPSFTVRRADTAVELASGQTFALAGLFQREYYRNIDKLPILGDVPVLGQLFRSERYRRNETELVILITPYLVNPISDRNIATPLDRANWDAGDEVYATSKGTLIPAAESEGSSGFILK